MLHVPYEYNHSNEEKFIIIQSNLSVQQPPGNNDQSESRLANFHTNFL